MKNLFRKVITRYILPDSQVIYAQSGEDIILAHLFYKLGIEKVSYLDIGANDPVYISNTYYFYLRGGQGVCIEPNPRLYNKIKKVRPRDIVINAGVGLNSETEADFYLFPDSAHGLSTFSKKEADHWAETGMEKVGKIKYEKVIKMPLITINSVMEKYFEKVPDFITIDVEGLDLQILQSLDFERFGPRLICVETLEYDSNRVESRNEKIINFLVSKGYTVFADTHINTIFLKNTF